MGLVSAMSIPMSAAALLIEVGVPAAEALACCSSGVVGEPAGLHLMWVGSAMLQCGILLLMPLTDVSLGCLLFHAALLHAAAHVGALRATHHAPRAVSSRWSRLCAAVFNTFLVVCLSSSSVQCHLQPSKPRVQVATRLTDKFIKTLTPMSKTSWEYWPCAPQNAFQNVDRGARPPLGVFTALVMAAALPTFLRQRGTLLHWLLTRVRWRSAIAAALVIVLTTVAVDLVVHVAYFRHNDSGPVVLHLGNASGAIWSVPESAVAGRRTPGGVAPFLGGGHFWHVAIGLALSTAANNKSDAAALLLCAGSRLHGRPLVSATRMAMGVPQNVSIAWFQLKGAQRVECPGQLHCRDWCTQPCAELNGDLHVECGGCSSVVACWPGSGEWGGQ